MIRIRLMLLSVLLCASGSALAESPAEWPSRQVRVIVLTTYDADEDVFRAMQSGAKSYLLKDMSTEEIAGTIRSVHQGGTEIPPRIAERLAERAQRQSLTQREQEVLHLLVRGRSWSLGDQVGGGARCGLSDGRRDRLGPWSERRIGYHVGFLRRRGFAITGLAAGRHGAGGELLLFLGRQGLVSLPARASLQWRHLLGLAVVHASLAAFLGRELGPLFHAGLHAAAVFGRHVGKAVGDRRRQDWLQPRDQRRYPGRHALADRSENAAKVEPVHQRAGRETMGGLRPTGETCASDACDQRHEDDDKDHAQGQKCQRLDVRQAIAGTDEAGAPKQNENDRSSRDRQLREAR